MKKVAINIFLIITIFIIYFLQSNFFSWFNISGIMPNVFVIFVLFVGLFAGRTMGIIYGIVVGTILDVLMNNLIGINIITYSIIGFLAGIFDKNFSKDNRMIIMIMVIGTTLIFEITNYTIRYVVSSINLEIVTFLKMLVIETIFNMLITIIIYPLMQKSGYYIEDIYKGNKILTRYF